MAAKCLDGSGALALLGFGPAAEGVHAAAQPAPRRSKRYEGDATIRRMATATQPAQALAHEAREGELRAWLGAIQAQDQSALAQFYDATVGRVYGLALRITRSRETAEEVAEDVYMQVWRDASRFDPQRGVGVLGWLLVICRSRALDALRRADEAEAHPEPHSLVPELGGDDTPEALLQAAQQNSALRAALEQLNAVQRQLLALAFFRGLTHDEIAAQLGMPLGTVKSHIRRALLALKEHFEARQLAKAS